MTTVQTTTGSDLIPILDLDPLLAGEPDALPRLGAELARALEDIGFFFITNHGVPWELVTDVYDLARRLHALPPEELEPITMDAAHGGYLPYAGGTSYASEIAGEVRTPNLNAAFFVHRNGYRVANRWPDLEGFQPTVEAYIDAVEGLCHRLLPVLASSLGLAPDHFAPHFDAPSCTLRMSHYPVVDYGEHDWGLAPHTDSSIFTLLPTNEVPGLEIRPAGYDWIEPPHLPQAYLVNSGDMLKRWTNHRFRSTAHRARNASDGDRYAMPFFFGARDDALIEALPTCVSIDNPARHEPITYGDYQRWFLNRNYAGLTGKQAEESAP
jgi:isopenicillin N synthase-like dioxygenase